MGCSASKTGAAAAPPATAPAVAPEGDFKVTVERTGEGQTIGLTIIASKAPAGILVQALKDEGLVPAYNKQNEGTPDQQVKAGDVIVAINSVFEDYEKMKKELQQPKVAMTVKRVSAASAAAPAAAAAPTETAAEPAAEPAAGAEAPAAPAEAAAATEAAKEETEAPAPEAATAAAEAEPATAAEPAKNEAQAQEEYLPVTEEPGETKGDDQKKCCC
eukprot:TRINITY_DN4237_c0_g1_i1.p1 TRINITY_DN4237_c0_g1~~TRINITY_DN4237_c0_g1_i1.p1  ORF type:complete len:217 (-),score=97.87 TRINITY_DN4237_c0_g1_i1:302-952(-)